MIIITGATGQLGRAIAEHLLARLPPASIGVSVRDPAKAADLAAKGLRVRHGDFNDPASLDQAFEGATQVLIVSSNARATGGDPLVQHRAAILAARAAGARRILYTSHMAVGATSAFPPMHDHAATEAMLAELAPAWTALRHGFYAASGLALMGNWRSGTVAAPADGKIAWTAHADLAEAAAIILAEGRHDGPTAPLTGTESLDLAGLSAIASQAIDRPVTRTVITDTEFKANLATRGTPAPAASIALGLYAAARAGEFGTVDPALEALLGRPPLGMREIIMAAVG